MRAAAISTMVIAFGASAANAAVSAREEKELRKTTYDYAKCVIKTHHNSAFRMIVADEDNDAIIKKHGDLIDSDCMGRIAGNVKMTFGGDFYRYALADALVNQDFASSGPTDFSDRLPLAHILSPNAAALDANITKTKNMQRRDALRSNFDKEIATAWLSRYGECVVRQDPTNARLWILTPPDGPEETSRINALRPAFAACMDGTMTFSRMTMRGTVALNYYRLAMATPVPASKQAN